ncbi:DNase I-like protein [Athelia psychrophila]|uniref:DNase I-like protein n=1 Tax=Athelia psychrophila TaxID=1759441 RepID=A0A166JRS9_9AGAM|nr:DNase I-like protein [Fibularhizoctonia sp. CBS 109695]
MRLPLTETRGLEALPTTSTPDDGLSEIIEGLNKVPKTASGVNLETGEKRSRASIKIATLNLNGKGTLIGDTEDNKWLHVNQLMREQKIGVLAIQEAHLTTDFVEQISDLFQRRLHIIWSQGENKNAAGVAFVVNKELANIEKIKLTEIIPGRAAMITLPWNHNRTLRILNIYAPNDQGDSGIFWTEIINEMDKKKIDSPDIMMGDFNTVEDSIDRLPNKSDPAGTTEALRTLRGKLNLIDGWRTTNPTEKSYTHFSKTHNTYSRLDRIYATNAIHNTASDWDIAKPAIKTDHKMATVRITNPSMPFIGKGRWSMPIHLLKNKKFLTMRDMSTINERTEENNVQHTFERFKHELATNARNLAKAITPKINKDIERLEEEVKTALNEEDKTERDTITEAGILERQLDELKRSKHAASRMTVKVKDKIFGETITSEWTSGNKERTPRDVITAGVCLEYKENGCNSQTAPP